MPREVEEAGLEEAELVEAEDGVVPDGDGWFTVNVADVQGLSTDRLGIGVMFERDIGDFPQLGETRFPVSEAAARYGASVESETDDPAMANADLELRRAKLGRVPW